MQTSTWVDLMSRSATRLPGLDSSSGRDLEGSIPMLKSPLSAQAGRTTPLASAGLGKLATSGLACLPASSW